MKKTIVFIFLALVVGTSSNLFAQEDDESNSQEIDYSTFKLPPIDSFIVHLPESPRVSYYEARKAEAHCNLISEKKNILKYMNLSAGYQYGYLGGSSITGTDNNYNNLYYYQSSQNATNYYHVGVSIGIPFDEIFDKRNRINKLKIVMSESDYEKAAFLSDQKMILSETYYETVRCLKVLPTYITSTKLCKASLEVANQDFINGQLDPGTLAQKNQSYNDALSALETLKAKLYANLIKLEVMSNYKFIKQ